MSAVQSLQNAIIASARHQLESLQPRSLPSNNKYRDLNLKHRNPEARPIDIDIDIDLDDIKSELEDVISDIEGFIDNVGDEVSEIIEKAIEEIRDILKTIPEDLEDYFRDIADKIQERVDPIADKIKEIVWTDENSIKNGLKSVIEFLDPVIQYVKENPQVILRLVVPITILLVVGMGFTPAGIVAGSLAAVLHSQIGNVGKDSLVSYLQSIGAKGWAHKALLRSNVYISIALLIVNIGMYVADSGMVSNPDEIEPGLENSWDRILELFEDGESEDTLETHINGAGSGVLKFDRRVMYGLFACFMVQVAANCGA